MKPLAATAKISLIMCPRVCRQAIGNKGEKETGPEVPFKLNQPKLLDLLRSKVGAGFVQSTAITFVELLRIQHRATVAGYPVQYGSVLPRGQLSSVRQKRLNDRKVHFSFSSISDDSLHQHGVVERSIAVLVGLVDVDFHFS